MRKKLIGLFSIALMASAGLGMATVGAAAAAPTAEDLIMVNGASVRYAVEGEKTNYAGIRFASYVSQTYRTNNPDNEIGMLIIPTELLNGQELTASVANVSIAKAEVIVSLEETDELYKAGYDCFKTVLYNIPEEHYGKQLSARAYVKEGENYTPIGETQVRSMAQVAWTAYQNPKYSAYLTELGGYLAGVEITAPETLALAHDGEQALGATVSYVGITPKYESSNENVATVDADGKVTAVSGGTATITTSVGGVEKETTVTVAANPIADTDPEGTFWSFEDGNALPNGASYYSSTTTGQMNVSVNADNTKSLIIYKSWGSWFGFTNATASVPPTATKQIVVRMRANAADSVPIGKLYFDGPNTSPTEATVNGVTGTTIALTTEWQEVTLTFAKDITQITGFQLATTDLAGQIEFDYFAFAISAPADPIEPTDPEGTLWSFGDGNRYPTGSVRYNSYSDTNMSVVDNGNGGKALKVAGSSSWVGFAFGSTDGSNNYTVSSTGVTKLVMKIKASQTITDKENVFWISNGNNYSKAITIATEWSVIEVEFNNAITDVFQFCFANMGFGVDIYIDYIALA